MKADLIRCISCSGSGVVSRGRRSTPGHPQWHAHMVECDWCKGTGFGFEDGGQVYSDVFELAKTQVNTELSGPRTRKPRTTPYRTSQMKNQPSLKEVAERKRVVKRLWLL